VVVGTGKGIHGIHKTPSEEIFFFFNLTAV
jgi:hypothetical protein